MKTLSKSNAFTLVEVVMASLIVGGALLTGLLLIAAQWRIINQTDEEAYVTRVLEARLEEVRDLTFDELKSNTGSTSFDPTPVTDIFGEAVNESAQDDKYELGIKDPDGKIVVEKITDELYRVTVDLTWKKISTNQSRNRNLVSYISKNGINRR